MQTPSSPLALFSHFLLEAWAVREGIFNWSHQRLLPASSAVVLKMGGHGCQIAPEQSLISGLAACVLEIPVGSRGLSLLL